jgi:hypothetical protein
MELRRKTDELTNSLETDNINPMYYVLVSMTWRNRTCCTSQKQIITIMTGVQPRTSCNSLLKQKEILPVPCQYTLSLMNISINNQEFFETNSSIHKINTRNKHHLHRPNVNLSCVQKLCWHQTIQLCITQYDNP